MHITLCNSIEHVNKYICCSYVRHVTYMYFLSRYIESHIGNNCFNSYSIALCAEIENAEFFDCCCFL